jgi:hypothetical protein
MISLIASGGTIPGSGVGVTVVPDAPFAATSTASGTLHLSGLKNRARFIAPGYL